MIAASRMAATLALVLAAVLHLSGLIGFAPEAAVETEGSAGLQEVRLGTAFSDMAAGSVNATEADHVAEPTRPEVTKAVEPEPIPPKPPAEAIEHAVPHPVETATLAETAGRAAVEKSPQSPSLARAEQPSPPKDSVVMPEEIAAMLPVPAAITSATLPESARRVDVEEVTGEPMTAAERALPEAMEAAEPLVEALAGIEPGAAPTRSPRPARREPPAEVPEPAPEPDRQQAGQTRAGNAPRNATAGATSGSASAVSATNGSEGRSRETGSAASSNYPGQVMRHLSRVARPRIRARGAAVVAFQLAGSGGLAGLGLARSSGSEALDRAAVAVVKSAAPFPAPPSGAKRSFTVQIRGR